MRKLLVLLILALSALWGYTSWYWYTCSIKGFCGTGEVVVIDDQGEEEVTPSVEENPVDDTIKQEPVDTIVEVETKVIEPVIEKAPDPEPVVVTEKKECETLIVTPIKLGAQNDSGDVKDLEDFLNAFEGESLEVDGVYGQADFEAVKRFQQKHADEILTPWGVKAPTGYVYKTTTKKINEVYCSQ